LRLLGGLEGVEPGIQDRAHGVLEGFEDRSFASVDELYLLVLLYTGNMEPLSAGAVRVNLVAVKLDQHTVDIVFPFQGEEPSYSIPG
jgi:hypothetical protein